jgi:hypothetical protein
MRLALAKALQSHQTTTTAASADRQHSSCLSAVTADSQLVGSACCVCSTSLVNIGRGQQGSKRASEGPGLLHCTGPEQQRLWPVAATSAVSVV